MKSTNCKLSELSSSCDTRGSEDDKLKLLLLSSVSNKMPSVSHSCMASWDWTACRRRLALLWISGKDWNETEGKKYLMCQEWTNLEDLLDFLNNCNNRGDIFKAHSCKWNWQYIPVVVIDDFCLQHQSKRKSTLYRHIFLISPKNYDKV